MDIYFNFSESLEEQNGTPTTIVGNPKLDIDPETGLQACLFDGSSAIQTPNILVEKNPFTIEVIFRPLAKEREAGIFGSNGYRVALRSDRKSFSYTFWANFPSSIDKKAISFPCSEEDWFKEHYFIISRRNNVYTAYFDSIEVGKLTYDYNLWSLPLYLGYYYDILYSFVGYIREYKFSPYKSYEPDSNSSVIIPKTLRDLTHYETG